jgi:2'-5' RNA ligase
LAESAFIVRVASAEPHVRELREKWDPAARLGVPAHVTVLFPFLSPERIDAKILAKARSAFAKHDPFDFRLARVGRFPGVIYLAPDPAAPFVALTKSLVREFPDHPPYGGQFATIVPHLTVAHAKEAELAPIEAQLLRSLKSSGAATASCREITLIENSSGRWKPMHAFPLE